MDDENKSKIEIHGNVFINQGLQRDVTSHMVLNKKGARTFSKRKLTLTGLLTSLAAVVAILTYFGLKLPDKDTSQRSLETKLDQQTSPTNLRALDKNAASQHPRTSTGTNLPQLRGASGSLSKAIGIVVTDNDDCRDRLNRAAEQYAIGDIKTALQHLEYAKLSCEENLQNDLDKFISLMKGESHEK